MEKTELKPCPFCGSAARAVYSYLSEGIGVGVMCTNRRCLAMIPLKEFKDQAFNAWNRRS